MRDYKLVSEKPEAELFADLIRGSRERQRPEEKPSGIVPRPQERNIEQPNLGEGLRSGYLEGTLSRIGEYSFDKDRVADAITRMQPRPDTVSTGYESLAPLSSIVPQPRPRMDTTREALGLAPTRSPVPQPRPDTRARSVRNNNPGNIERNQTTWQGMAEDQSADDRFAVFESPEMGVRAMARTLNTYNTQYGLNTIEGIVRRWAPPNENDTNAYIRFVSQRSGVAADKEINFGTEQDELNRVMRAMIEMEGGPQAAEYFTPEIVSRGIELSTTAPKSSLVPQPRPQELQQQVAETLPAGIAETVQETEVKTPADINRAIFNGAAFSGELATPSRGEDPITWIADNAYGISEDNADFRRAMQGLVAGVDPETTPWCAAFAGHVLRNVGVELPELAQQNPNLAFNYQDIGEEVYNYNPRTQTTYTGSSNAVRPGDVIIFNKNPDRQPDGSFGWGQGHISFIVDVEDDGTIIAVGGNQSDRVQTSRYTPSSIARNYPGGFRVRRITDASLEQTSPEVISAITRDIAEGGAGL